MQAGSRWFLLRITGEGYKGILSQPDPEKKPDFHEGLLAMRRMHLRAIDETGLTAADEMLYPENWPYVDDILSYVAVGARSVEDRLASTMQAGFFNCALSAYISSTRIRSS